MLATREDLQEFRERVKNESGNHKAPPGILFVCLACGKLSRDRYGDDALAGSEIWDESCMLNCQAFLESDIIPTDCGMRAASINPPA